jgi:hypothetical protein
MIKVEDAVEMVTSDREYPRWSTNSAILVDDKKDAMDVQYKYIIKSQNKVRLNVEMSEDQYYLGGPEGAKFRSDGMGPGCQAGQDEEDVSESTGGPGCLL